CARLLCRGLRRGMLRARIVSLHRLVPVRPRRNLAVGRRHRDRGIFAIGGLFYTMTVSRFLSAIGVRGMMISGATLVALQLIATAFGPAWKLQFVCMLVMGWGFYMIHGCLQVFASELSVEARATALSLHSFFFFMG